MATAPDALKYSVEKLLLDTMEPLDPYVALKLTQLALNLVEMSYTMGHADGRRTPAEACPQCPLSGL